MSTDLSTTAHDPALTDDIDAVTPAPEQASSWRLSPADDAGTKAQRAYSRWAIVGALIPLLAASYNIWGTLTALGGMNPLLAVVPAVALEVLAIISLMGARADAKNGREPSSSEMYVITGLSGLVGAMHWFIERVGAGFAISDFAWSVGPTAIILGLLSLVWPVLGARALHKALVGEREAITGSTRAQRAAEARAARMDRRARHLVHEWAKAREVWRELRRAEADPRKIRTARDNEQAARNKALAAGWFWENGRFTYFEGMTIQAFEAAVRVHTELLAAADDHGAVLDTLGVPGAVAPADYVRTADDATPALETIEEEPAEEEADEEEAAPAPRLLVAAPDVERPDGRLWASMSRSEQDDLIKSMRGQGRSYGEIAEKVGLRAASTISRRAKELGLTGTPTPAEGIPAVQVAELVG
ncbi:hypothetical protein ACIGB8_28845 [Promicromonospora sukumoe]|uniref:hypothetical protein n=1 Tax=Promicromonospora sukumoe TaxID=88382 RepID=UPI0037C7DFCC